MPQTPDYSGRIAKLQAAMKEYGLAAVILVPIKNTSGAKQRLASLLDQQSRTRLAQAMLHDVLSAAAKRVLG
jgi:hypothetical protein